MAKSRRGLTQDLLPFVRNAIGFGDLRVVFQPVVDIRSGEVLAYEALARSQDPAFPSPPVLISAAIQHDCCGELGRILRALAIEGCPSAALFLNIHPKEFEEGWLLRPDDPIFRHDQPVYLEITESVPLSLSTECFGTLREIRNKGVRLVVDDLGAGYSNLKYIADLAPEVVKLDRGLVASLTLDTRLYRLVRALVRLCVDLDAKVVAEGIETESELLAVRDAGVHYGQGYFLARPAFPPPLPRAL